MFAEWANRWMVLAKYEGLRVPDVATRIEQLRMLWQEPIPGSWQRGVDPQLHKDRYRRGDSGNPSRGEHMIEHAILVGHFERLSCFGNKVLDGVNAVPLVRDEAGGRTANVEADMLLLTEGTDVHRLFLCEVKGKSNNAWYAAVESLRQLRLFISSLEARRLFVHRIPDLLCPANAPVTGLVVAPYAFYSSVGQKAISVSPALELLAHFRAELEIDVRLAIWDPGSSNIDRLVM